MSDSIALKKKKQRFSFSKIFRGNPGHEGFSIWKKIERNFFEKKIKEKV